MKKDNNVNNSIAHKISKNFTLRSMGEILTFNIIIILLLSGYIIYDSERDMKSFANVYAKENIISDSKILINFGYDMEITKGKKSRISFGKTDSFNNIISSVEHNYLLSEADGEFVYIKNDLGKDLNLLKNFIIIFLIIEIIGLIVEYRKNKIMVNRMMEPLDDIISAAQVLNQASDLSKESLKKLEGTLNSISAKHLETRLPVEGARTELRALSTAINDMLDRIDKAYSSQARFVSDASHELRTPIAIIQSYASLLDRWGFEDAETTKEAINAIKSEAESMKILVEQLLFLARGDNETISIKAENIDLGATTSISVSEMQMIDKCHKFNFEALEKVYVIGDIGLIKQLIRILIDNSIKYTPNDGNINVKVYKKENYGVFQIQDEGQGISCDELPQVFERFYRTDKSRSRSTGGSGLGLSIGKWIAEKHGGYISILSREGIGTRIEVELPLLKS